MQHYTTHRGEFKCQYCQRNFVKQHNFFEHIRLHTEEGRSFYQCHICPHRFAVKYKLKAHIEYHREEKATLSTGNATDDTC